MNAVIANDPVIHDIPNGYDNSGSGIYKLSSAIDFGSGGRVDWWGAQAYVSFLNSIDYAGSSQWVVPTTPDSESSYGYMITGQLGQLF